MTSLGHPRLSGLARNPAAPQDVLVCLAVHPAGRHGLSLRGGQLADAVVEALLTHDGGGSAANLRRDRISPEMRRRTARHPDPAIRDGHADFVRRMVDREVDFAVLTCVPGDEPQRDLIAGFEIIGTRTTTVPTMNGHESTGIQILARKPTET
jgi:hypothetical protein